MSIPVASKGHPRSKHIPQRTCIGCRRSSGKRDFVRLVRLPEGRLEVDPTGKKPGRGAYLCSDPACWQAALRRDRLAAALRIQISDEDRSTLLEYARSMVIA
jgi:predicted RNA-binding protein YlxR (DUF448 family)